jgi:N-acetylglucosaminyldiphosphoundecaprenol N-acetyl-beta-D-mannosaminyltransferase
MSTPAIDADRGNAIKGVFGFPVSSASAHEIAMAALQTPRTETDGVALVVTPNIDHIAKLRSSPDLSSAYRRATIVVCDGWPVRSYARLRGIDVQRVTGCDIAAFLMRAPSYGAWQRLFFVVDTVETEACVRAWAARKGVADRVEVAVPPFGFDRDQTGCRVLAEKIRSHGTTLLMMGVGAPRSEVFVDRMRAQLPACWVFCVGQAIKIEVGLVRRAPRAVQALGLEWLWRVGQEPGRLARRYAVSSVVFLVAILEDLWRGRASGIGSKRAEAK